MQNAEGNIKEFNSYTNYPRQYEIHESVPFHAIFGFHTSNDFLNSSVLNWTENKLTTTALTKSLVDKNYFQFLSKIERDFVFVNDSTITLYFVQEKFSEIYDKLMCFKFESISVEYTYDNSLLFSIKNGDSKYMLEYYLDYKIEIDDDVEIIFTKLNSKENKFYEMRLEEIHDFLNNEIKKKSISKILF